MAYEKTLWTELTKVTATLLNKIEDGIKVAHDLIAGINWSTLSGKPSTFAPSSHDNSAHSTNYEPAFSKNNAFNKNFGSSADTVCQGNDTRLSNARTPVAHGHAASDISSGIMDAARLPTTAVNKGGTGATSAAAARSNLGAEAILNANQKRQIFVQSAAPSGQATGDLWIW